MGTSNRRCNNKDFAQDFDGNKSYFTFVKALDAGAFGEADLCSVTRPIVLKKVKLDSSILTNNPDMLTLAEQEANLLARLPHPNIVRIYHAWLDESSNRLIMELEFCGGGSLLKAINHNTKIGVRFTLDEVQNWLAQLTIGMAYLHDLHIVHRDLSSDNILLSADKTRIKIADFGIAELLSKDTMPSRVRGHLLYVAPEVVCSHCPPQDQFAVDVWAVGVIAYELATLELPYKIGEYSSRPCLMDEVAAMSAPLYDLIENKLLIRDPCYRVRMCEVLRHPFHVEKIKEIQRSYNDLFYDQIRALQKENENYRDEIKRLKETVADLNAELDATRHNIQNFASPLCQKKLLVRRWSKPSRLAVENK